MAFYPFVASPSSPGGAGLSLQVAPTGATGETIPFRECPGDSGSLVSGTLFCFSIALLAATLVSNITMVIGNTAEVGGTHGAYLLIDNTRKVVAVSADQTTNAWAPANTPLTLAMGTPFTTLYTGRYYACVYQVATTPSSFAASSNVILGGVSGILPVLSGTSSAGLTTPPALGSTVAALAAFNGLMYAYTS